MHTCICCITLSFLFKNVSFNLITCRLALFANPCNDFEAVVFGDEHCATLKNAAKSRKPADSVIEYDSMQENMQQIADMIKTEKQEELSKHTGATPDEAKQDGQSAADEKVITSPDGPHIFDQKPKSMAKLEEQASAQWWKVAEKTMCQYVRLIVMPSTAENLTAELASHELGTVAGDACGLVMIHMDIKLSCEGTTAPFIRMPPLRPQNYDMMSRGVLGARTADGKLQKGDLVCLLNGGKPGHCVIFK